MPQMMKVEWWDHFSGSGWREAHSNEDFNRDHLVASVGWKLAENKKFIILATSVSENGNYADTMHIMKRAIKSKKVLR